MIPRLRWATLHPAAAVSVVLAAVCAVALLPQIIALVLVTSIFHVPVPRLDVVSLASLWNSSALEKLYTREGFDPVQVHPIILWHYVFVAVSELLLVAITAFVVVNQINNRKI